MSHLTIQPLTGQGGVNWIFLIEILLCAILAVFFLFYSNRLFATLVSYCIRAYTWHKFRAYIDITSLQISLLGGRIFFKSIRYHAHNVTCLVHEGHITWRYWLASVQEAEVFTQKDGEHNGNRRSNSAPKSDDEGKSSSEERANEKTRSRSVGKEESGGAKIKKDLPCRISVKVSAVEAFVYNRSPSYDAVLEQILRKSQRPASASGSNENGTAKAPSPLSGDVDEEKRHRFGWSRKHDNSAASPLESKPVHAKQTKPEPPAFLRLFPVKIECRRAAATLGNESTTNVIIAKVEKAAGTIDAGHAGPLDLYKLLFNFDMEKCNATMRPNRDFKQLQLDAAQRILRERETAQPVREKFNLEFFHRIRMRWQAFLGRFSRTEKDTRSLRTASLKSKIHGSHLDGVDNIPQQGQWSGLDRYMEDKELDEHDEWKGVEYAKASTLADIEKLNMNFYFDMPGTVQDSLDTIITGESSGFEDDMNGAKPPDYGMEFAVYGGVVTYGPWADRQRLNIQQIFFPASYVDAVPAPPLKPGDTRNWTIFNIFISIEEDVTLRIPSREPSKDEKWQGRSNKGTQTGNQQNDNSKRKTKYGRRHKHARRSKGKQGTPGLDARPYGWLDIVVKTDTTVRYVMDMFPRQDGYRNSLDVDCKATEINSSVNHGLLWRTGPISVVANLSQAAQWNTVRKWPFDITITDMELFILRDHLFLIIDLVNDWSYGPPVDFFTFVPYIYSLRLLFRNFVMYLNVNDANIVNDADNFDKNDFLTLEGFLDSTLNINMDQYRPVRNMITFDVLAENLRMRMLSPSKSTISLLLKDNVVADLPKLTLYGSYSGHIEERPGLVDALRFDIVGSGLTLKAYGFLVRQLINIKENYFGDYMHFKTLEEFQGADEDLAIANVKTASLPKPSFINELDVMLCIVAEDVTVLLPTNLYSPGNFVRAELPVANLDLRIVSYYLDMGLQLSPVTFLSGSSASGDDSPTEVASQTQFFVKHVNLDGHRSFGLPPNEPAYISQWDIDIGAITGEFSSSFIHDLAMGGRAFIFAFQDGENALPLPSPSVFYDATFVQVRTDILRLWFHVGKDALLFSADPVEVVTNDWASDNFSQRVCVVAPKLTLACVDARSASRHRIGEKERIPVRTYAFFQTGAAVNVILRKLNFEDETRKQQGFILENDQRTRRAPFLIRHRNEHMTEHRSDFYPPTMPYPSLPPPLDHTGSVTSRPASVKSLPTYAPGQQIRSKGSSSSLSASLRKESLAVPAVVDRKQSEQASGASSSRGSIHSSSSASSIRSSARPRPKAATPGDLGSVGLPPSTIAFSTSFAEPYFPLDLVEPDETNVPDFASVASGSDSDAESQQSSIADTFEGPEIDGEVAQTSVLIQISPGIRAYFEPRVVETAAKLFRKILAKSPEEVMDAFQMDVMGAVVAKHQGEHGTGHTLEIQAALPAADFRLLNPRASADTCDQLDLNVRSVDTLVRLRRLPSASGAQEILAIHAAAQNIDASFNPSAPLHAVDPAVKAHIDDVLVWVASAASQSIHANAGDTTFSIAGEQAESIVDFVIRVLPLAMSLKAKVEAPIKARRNRLLLMINTLTQHGEDIGDPAYLSRITYILRAFPDHFRNSESWKVVSRFRHILQNLTPETSDHLIGKIKDAKPDCPVDEPAQALDQWAQWQNWDVPNVHQTVAFQLLFSEEEGKALHVAEDKPLLLTLRSDYLRIAVEAEEVANEIVIRQTTIGVESTPPTVPTGLMLVDENTRKKTMVQMHSTSVAILANWSAFNIAERVLAFKPKLEKLPLPTPKAEQPSASKRFEDSLYRHIFQVAVSTDSGSITLQSINLRHLSRADGLRLSLIGTTQADEERYGPCATGIVNADTAVTELFSGSTSIWRTNLLSPSIYADHVRPFADTGEPPSTYIAVGYKVLEMSLLEQVPGLLRIVDLVIFDEVTKVVGLLKLTTPPAVLDSQAPAPMQPASSSSPVKIHMALLAGDLAIEVSLLQSIKYLLTGTAASVRLAPSLMKDQAWAIDFDVGGQSHRFVNSSTNKRQEQSILDVPPINGHVGVDLGSEATSLSVAATMERVEVNAAAIQGVAATMNQPEIKDVISAVQSGVEEIKGHISDIIPKPAVSVGKTPDAKKPLAFHVRFALLGVRMAAVTKRAAGGSTHIEFGIGPLHVAASNRETMVKSKLLLPEVRAQIRDIGARIQIHEDDRCQPCGHLTFGLDVHFRSWMEKDAKVNRTLKAQSQGLEVYAYPHTASTAVETINYMQERLKSLDLSKEVEYLHRLGESRKGSMIQKISGRAIPPDEGQMAFSAEDLLSISTTVQLHHIRATWVVDQLYASSPNAKISDLVLGLERVEFTTRGGREARLTIENLQLSLTKKTATVKLRSLNSALLPEMTFSVGYWSVGSNRNLTFKAAGNPLELRLESRFIVPVNALSKSINAAIEQFRSATVTWEKRTQVTTTEAARGNIVDVKRIASVLVEADFAGAQFYVQGSGPREPTLSTLTSSSQRQGAQHGRYGQFAAEGVEMQTMLKAPGIAMKIEYNAASSGRPPTLNAEVKIDASSNMVLPNVVPLLLEVSHSVREVMKRQQQSQSAVEATTPTESRPVQKLLEDDSIIVADPAVLFGKTKLDIGFRICRQEFGLTCQPIARVDAKAELDDFYFTVNTIQSDEHGHFFAITAVITKLGASVKHVYSREPTFTYQMDSIVLSVMNSKHLSGEPGISAILKINPTRTFINGKQLQDLLLFREIWMPPEIRTSASSSRPSTTRQDEFFMQKYRAAAAAAAFPWNATVSIAELAIDLDLGQSIGKSSFSITNLWASQTKSSSFEQNLCIGMDEMAMTSSGRMSGFIRLTKLGVRTSISWPQDAPGRQTTPLIQASLGFKRLLAKAAFDYQAFAFGDIEGFDFLMYNVHQPHGGSRDRLVAVLDCEKAYVFCTSTSPARAVGLYQAFDRLVQEKQSAFQRSLMDIEKYVRRESTVVPTRFGPTIPESPIVERAKSRAVISMHTDVVLTIGAISFGVYPGTFFDSQILKLEANTIQARFAAGLERGKVASSLGMTLGQLQVALASVKRATAVPKALDISVDEVVNNAINAKGGTILRVPKVVASMQTWQASHSKSVDYIFKSLFDGKIDVGWNLSRIDFIKNMWTAHTRSLASRLGKALPESAVKITAGPARDDASGVQGSQSQGQGKITAEVYLPQARYDYNALETPIIETPQLRDMGEATPPLEWIGLHRDRLPNVTHQIIIVSLLEVVKEVEDAYKSILGSSA